MARTYGRIETGIWQNPKFRNLTEAGQRLYLYLIACPHGNAIGCFVLPLGYATADLEWDAETVSETFSETVSEGLIDRDEGTGLTRIKGWWGHNTIENPNVAKAAARAALTLPHKSKVYRAFITDLEQHKERFKQTVWEPFRNGLPNPIETKEPEPEPKPEPEYSVAIATGAQAPLPTDVSRETKSDEGELLDLPDALRRPDDPWKDIYAGYKRHLGTRSGGLVSKIRGVSNIDEMRGWLVQLDAGEIADGHEYFGAILAKRVEAAIRPDERIPLPPDGFLIERGDENWNYAASLGMSPDTIASELGKFEKHHQAKGSRMVDWNKAFQGWCDNWKTFQRPKVA